MQAKYKEMIDQSKLQALDQQIADIIVSKKVEVVVKKGKQDGKQKINSKEFDTDWDADKNMKMKDVERE